jgi:hypothetical protein
LARPAGIGRQRIDEAALVIEYAPEMVDEVMANRASLYAAYNDANRRRQVRNRCGFCRGQGDRPPSDDLKCRPWLVFAGLMEHALSADEALRGDVARAVDEGLG